MHKIIQNNQKTRSEIPILIDTWCRMSRWQLHNQKNVALAIWSQSTNIFNVCLPCKIILYLQPQIDSGDIKEVWLPPKLYYAIRRLYTDNKVRLIPENIDIYIHFGFGLKQGDSVIPVLFLFIMMAFSETLENEWLRNGLQIIKFKRLSSSYQSSGRITSHP